MFYGASLVHTLIFVAAILAAVVGQFSDARTTQVGLEHGFAESNPVGYWLIKKLGIRGIYILKCAVFPATAVVFYALFGWNYGTVIALFFAGLGFPLGISNYLLIKKSDPNVSIF